MKAYKGNIIFTKTKDEFTTIKNGYVLVDDEGKVIT